MPKGPKTRGPTLSDRLAIRSSPLPSMIRRGEALPGGLERLEDVLPGGAKAAIRPVGLPRHGCPGVAPRAFADPPAIRGRSPKCLIFQPETESGRKDSNLRLPGPKPGALTRLSYAPSQGLCGPVEVYPKSAENQSGAGFLALPTTSPRVPHRQWILGVDAVEMEEEGIEVKLRRPVGIGGNHGRSPDRGYPLPLDPLWLTP